jgi:hypothetical protein
MAARPSGRRIGVAPSRPLRRRYVAVTSPLRRALVTALSSSCTSGHDGHGIAQARRFRRVVRPVHLLRRDRADEIVRHIFICARSGGGSERARTR